MEFIKDYLISIIAAAILCSLGISLIGKKSTYTVVVKLICSVIMIATIISPWNKVRFSDFTSFHIGLMEEADAAVFSGQTEAYEATAAIIKSKTEAYILDKASAMGLSIQVEVTVSDENLPAPAGIKIFGAVSPYAKQQLCSIISSDLGIPEDMQQWS